MFLEDCTIKSNGKLTDKCFLLEIHSEVIAEKSFPGQFVNIGCNKFLRRPISICSVNRKKNTFELGIETKGEGTEYLKNVKPGQKVSVLGPLGKGFDLEGAKKCLVIGGGIGIFPLIFLLEEAKRKNIDSVAVCGYKSVQESFLTSRIKTLADEVVFSSECKSMDVCGTVIDALEVIDSSDSKIYTCGPYPMMKKASEYAQIKGLECEVSMEERMACGTGICLVCACKVKAGEDNYDYERCCKEGPVFNSRKILWE